MSIDGAKPVHPTFLYESLWNLVGFVLLHLYSKRRKFRGECALLYVVWYGAGRAWIEGLRTDSLRIGSLRVSQMLAVVSCIAAVWVLVHKYHAIVVDRKLGRIQDTVPENHHAPEPANQPSTEQPEPLPETEAMPLPEQSPSPKGQPHPTPTPTPTEQGQS